MAKPEHLDHHETNTASSAQQKLTLFALTTMVVGGMVGAGIFSLPRTFARRDWADRRRSSPG